MPMSCLLAVAMLMGGPWSGAGFVVEDTTSPPSAGAQTETPAPPENAPNEPAKNVRGEENKAAGGAEKKAGAPVARRAKRHRKHKAAPKPVAEGRPHKIVIREGGAREPSAQIVPGMTPEEAVKQRQSTEDMLVSAGDHLKLLEERRLDSGQQETVTQIRNYMDKARSALRDGDTQRGHTLALKAYLLADDLVKH